MRQVKNNMRKHGGAGGISTRDYGSVRSVTRGRQSFMPFPTYSVGTRMTQSVVDQRGRVLIPEAVREGAGLGEGTIVRVERQEEGIVIKPVRRGKRTWKQLCGLVPARTGKPDWPTPGDIKSIWR